MGAGSRKFRSQLIQNNDLKIENCHDSVIVYIDLSGKEPHIQVGVDRVLTSGSLDGVMVNIYIYIYIYIPGIQLQVRYFSFISHVQAVHSMVGEPTLCMYNMYGQCLYACNL